MCQILTGTSRMLIRVLTLRFDALLEGFDDTPVRDFVKDKEVLAIGAHFFSKNQGHYLTVVVTYALPSPTAEAAPRTVPARTPREAPWRDLLTEADMPLFDTLRDWRRTQSQREGVPPYIICNNRQCALLVRSRPQTLAALGAIEGFGTAKLERYGQALLASPTRETNARDYTAALARVLAAASRRGTPVESLASACPLETL